MIRAMRYYILAHRSANSMFGSAESPLKKDGEVQFFDALLDAQNEASRLNERMGYRGNVWYTIERTKP